jgi:hypothetical protein
MKHLKIISVIFLFLFSFSSQADSNVIISKWQEETMLNATGKSSEILIEGLVKNLPANRVLDGFFFQFSKDRSIKITNIICNSKRATYSFKDNKLSIKFPSDKKNNDKVSVYISYNEIYEKVGEFLRQELIDVPPFAAGSQAKVVIRFPGYLESATLNPNIKKIGRGFIYNSIVPQEGVREIIKLTPAETVWDVTVKVKVNSNKPIESASVKTPFYFTNGGQEIKNFVIASNPPSSGEKDYKENRQIIKFDKPTTSILIENKARIFSGKNHAKSIARNPDNYLGYNQYESSLLKPLLSEISKSPKYQKLPLYAKIGKFVHDFIEYDLSYVGKLPNLETILKTKIGVCTEYAKLYDGLARVAGIPSLVVNGAACGDEDGKCRGHSWNLIYYNNHWMYVDPTWDLMSGNVSSSHVYFNDNNGDEIQIFYVSQHDDEGAESKIDFEMKKAY